jgi:hypothetical protein
MGKKTGLSMKKINLIRKIIPLIINDKKSVENFFSFFSFFSKIIHYLCPKI